MITALVSVSNACQWRNRQFLMSNLQALMEAIQVPSGHVPHAYRWYINEGDYACAV